MFRLPIRAARLATALAAAVTFTVACATAGGRTEGPTVPIDLQVENNLRVPTDLSVYAVTRSGSRMLLGDVPPGQNKTFRFKPIAFTEPYRLLAILPSGHQIRSEPFIVGSDMTGGIVWTLVPNIVGFLGVDSDTTGSP